MHKLFRHKYYHFAIHLVEAADLPRSRAEHYSCMDYMVYIVTINEVWQYDGANKSNKKSFKCAQYC